MCVMCKLDTVCAIIKYDIYKEFTPKCTYKDVCKYLLKRNEKRAMVFFGSLQFNENMLEEFIKENDSLTDQDIKDLKYYMKDENTDELLDKYPERYDEKYDSIYRQNFSKG